MTEPPQQLTLHQWDSRYVELTAFGWSPRWYDGPLCRHAEGGDTRLLRLRFDNSTEALTLWNFLLTEEDRLKHFREQGAILIGTMKDLGTVPVMAFALPNVVAFYPDGAWWIPCVMEMSTGLLEIADSLGIDESFCPVRAMLGAFVTQKHFPIPDQLICSVGATCDDFSAIAQRLEAMGHPIMWWEIPHRNPPQEGEEAVTLPGGFQASPPQLSFVKHELERVKGILESASGSVLDDEMLSAGIQRANTVRRCLKELRHLTFTAPLCPMPALEMLIAEMLAIHFCSDRDESLFVLEGLLNRVRQRIADRQGYFGEDAARIFWVNPVADLRAMNILERCGGRLCGTEYLFSHALDEIPTGIAPLEALAQMALADPMVGSTADRADRIIRDIQLYGAEGLIISRIPGASHCALEGKIIARQVQEALNLPVLEIEVPPLSDAFRLALNTRISALVEVIHGRRAKELSLQSRSLS
ncbi:MAG: 2-hydroxyacyl-CoA dehydratase family protein [bacterium]